ncbi:hypothetical protein DPMN_032016 [Dreissena polymorpha]|uniref:Uncharacterized protein n=1 Tax=Dreissena polymorpha TaxID=45954 RepID=A0A9D4RJM7_DREPO|nr:hypothetical protein DPMN_032016 [Dreissena polymorpha]
MPSMSKVSPSLQVTSLTFKRASKWQLMTSAARPYDVLKQPDQRVSAGLSELYKHAMLPVFPITSLTLKMTSKLKILA